MNAPEFKYLLQYEIDFSTADGKELAKRLDEKVQGNTHYRRFFTSAAMHTWRVENKNGLKWYIMFKRMANQ